jgi:hypothetical protein
VAPSKEASAIDTILITEACGVDISSRSQAAALRERVVAHIKRLGIAYLDFTGIDTISEPFADEFFGVLVCDHDEFWFEDHVKVGGLSYVARETIMSAMSQRLGAA